MIVTEPVGSSLVLETVTVNESVTDAVPSLAVITTLWSPIWASSGVPVNAPAVQDIQSGTVVQVRVTVSPLSTSDAVVV